MPENINVKICGLTDPADVPAALLAGARTLGFVFFEKSPRHLSLEAAAHMTEAAPDGICKVAILRFARATETKATAKSAMQA